MFSKVLVANRGEIAVRVIRTLRSLGIASVAVYSDADESAAHVRDADEARWIGKAPAGESYLNIDRIVAAAVAAGAEAVHPGYGFLAENARFARACADAGLVFIGPPPSAIEAMGDKIAAKAVVSAAGVPVVPGAGAAGMPDAELAGAVDPRWFPVLIKPSAGGGGKGMRVVSSPAELPDALASARRTAVAAFGDGTLLIERYVPTPRHIEIQVLADSLGHVIHLGERECSLQRRHQKVIEEAPSPLLSGARRAAMGAAAVSAARSVGYVGAGTVEFIVAGDAPDDFFFMEMNTRLQVEHPVTELVYGLDLVEWQLRVAAGEALPFDDGSAPALNGHAVEARVYAEDPAWGFLPTGGMVLGVRWPGGPGVRVDSGIAVGTTVTSDYDPMLAKVAAWGPDRATALRRLDAALARVAVLGAGTNVAFLRDLLSDPDVVAGRLDTGLVERRISAAAASGGPRDQGASLALAAAALARALALEPAGAVTDPWDIPDGWRPGERAWTTSRLSPAAGTVVEVRVRGLASAGAEVAVGDGEPVAARASFRPAGGSGGTDLVLTYGGRTVRFAYAADGPVTWLGRDGAAWAIGEAPPAALRGARAGSADGSVRSPMPGTVLAVHVAVGDVVTAGQPVLVVEAMKMEHTVTAPIDGTVTELTAKAGQQVRMEEPLAVIGAESADGGSLGEKARMLSYQLDEEHEDLRKSVEEFARDVVAPVIGDLYEAGEFPYGIVAQMGRMGLFGLPVPEEYGGMGGDYLALCLALEELARVDSSVAITLEAGVGLGVMPMYRFGTEAQKREWLPSLCAGERLSAFGLTEPGGGTDVAGAMKTRARLEDGEWVIDGSKSFITNSGTSITAVVGVAAVTGTRPDGKPEISTILVPSGTAGFTVAPKYSKVGWCASDTHELSFSGCRVPEANLLGERGRGYAQFLRTLDEGRIAIAALSTGLAQGCVDESLAYVKERTAFGGPIGRFQALQFKIADMEVRTHNARLAWRHAAARMLAGEPFKKEAAIAKLTASNAAMDNARDATQVFGGYGFMNEFAVGRFYRDAKILEVGEGTSEVQRMLIARELGLDS